MFWYSATWLLISGDLTYVDQSWTKKTVNLAGLGWVNHLHCWPYPHPHSNSTLIQIVGIEGNKSFNPNPVVGRSGQTILWVNGDTISHTVTSNSHENGLSKYSRMLFDSTAILPGHFYSKVFDLPGTYLYYCFYHPSIIEVKVEP